MRLGAVVVYSSSAAPGGLRLLGTGVGPVAAFVPGNVSTFAGNGDYLGASWVTVGRPRSPSFSLPSAVAFDGAGNLYIADSAHNRVRMVCAGSFSGLIKGTQAKCTAPGIIFTIAGGGSGCGAGETDTFGDGCNAPASTLSSPTGVAVDGAGNLYITDNGNDLVRNGQRRYRRHLGFRRQPERRKWSCAGAPRTLSAMVARPLQQL